MHAVNNKRYKIYFGGSYTENWSEDYTLSVVYADRHAVEAEFDGERWQAVAGDGELCALLSSPDCPVLTRQYFEAAAKAYSAAQECLSRGLSLDRLGEFFRCEDNPLTAPELMRLLMDDCGFSMGLAYHVAAHCCADIRARDVKIEDVYALQPRTAHIISLIRATSSDMLSVAYDGRKKEYRSVSGAVCCCQELSLGFRIMGGRIRKAVLVLFGDNFRQEYPMERKGDMYKVSFSAPETAQALWYHFRIETEKGTHWLCADNSGYIGRLYGWEHTPFRLTVALPDFDTPAWFRRSVMYQVFPDRFAFSDDDTAKKGVEYHRALGQFAELHGSIDEPVRWQPREFETSYSPDDFYGGTFKGIEAKLPYLKELGISCLYLNPIVEARSNHRYDASDYMRPDPILGTMADFENLCKAAEEQGIRLILDGVFSHTGADSIYFNRYGNYPEKGACQGEDSPFYPWYDFWDFPGEYRSWWGFKDLPEVDERNSDWQDYVVTGKDSVVRHWLRRGAAGWRLDVADELPDEVLSLIRKAVKEENSDAPIIGEVWEDAVIKESYGSRRNYALGHSLDSVMNYPFRTAVLSFLRGHMDAYGLRDFLIGQQSNYPRPMYYSLMNLLGSHDVDRLRSALSVDFDIRALSREEQLRINFNQPALERALKMEKLAAAIQFAVPGVPSVYYGDEQGMCGVCDPFNRQPFKEGERELFEYYRTLAAQRNSADAMSVGEAEFMAASSNVLMILRYVNRGLDALGLPAEDGAYLTVVNRSFEAVPYSADCTVAHCGVVKGLAEPCSAHTVRLR